MIDTEKSILFIWLKQTNKQWWIMEIQLFIFKKYFWWANSWLQQN